VLHHDGATKTLTFGRISGGGRRSGPTADDQRCFGTPTMAETTAALRDHGSRSCFSKEAVNVATCHEESMLG
jgi:hypothetical protein